jgi:hypothetical protein
MQYSCRPVGAACTLYKAQALPNPNDTGFPEGGPGDSSVPERENCQESAEIDRLGNLGEIY